jgi:16S rRNA G1207 methylase RsmC
MSHDELRAFVRGLDSGAGAAARRLLRSYQFDRFMRMLDAGGGSGGLAITLCRACPTLRATIADLTNVATISREFVAEAEMTGQIDVINADLVATPPAGRYDVAVLRALLQVLGPDAAARVVANVGAAIDPGGEIFIVGRVLDDSRQAPLDTVAANLMFLNIYDEGQAYTEGEHRDWLTAAGFGDVERRNLSGGYSIIRGVKA